MEVYAVIYDWVDNFESNSCVELFSKEEDARKNIEDKIKEIKNEYDYDTFENPDENEFYGYNDGYYAEKHDRVRIEKIKIN